MNKKRTPDLNPRHKGQLQRKALEASDPVATLNRIQNEIGEWSFQNFGEQISKHTGWTMGATNPLLGLFEEIGEWFTSRTEADQIDAIADIMIYMCDFANRDECNLATALAMHRTTDDDPTQMVMDGMRGLAHCHLKRHQGIRGFDHNEKYVVVRNAALNSIVRGLELYCKANLPKVSPLTCLERVWVEVKARDWKKNPTDANEVAG